MMIFFWECAILGTSISTPGKEEPMKPFDGKRLAALALGALLCLCQAGCSFTGLDAQNLMSPPRANLEQQGIYELLQEGTAKS